MAFLDSVGVQNLTNSRRTIHAPFTKNKIIKNPMKFRINGAGLQGVNCNSYLEFSPSIKAHKFSQILIKMRLINITDEIAIFLLTEVLNNPNLDEYYAQEVLEKIECMKKIFVKKL